MRTTRALAATVALLVGMLGSEVVLPQQTSVLLSYAPPMRGAPATRLGGGTRGTSDAPDALAVLAPEHTGLTTSGQPSLVWYAGQPITVPVEITVVDPDAIDPTLAVTLSPPIEPGVHVVDLAARGVTLEPDREYQWFVAMVLDPAQRSRDVVAGAAVRRVAESPELRARLATTRGVGRAAAYATAGIWYDAVAELTTMITAAPSDPSPREARASLLEQVGLEDVARHDRTTSR
ncbi:MAG: DUF928 domain-containing protein [Chromatiales bacterium]|nr:DUF928 domain-containing protein [Chromatiales bacterium]